MVGKSKKPLGLLGRKSERSTMRSPIITSSTPPQQSIRDSETQAEAPMTEACTSYKKFLHDLNRRKETQGQSGASSMRDLLGL